MAIVDRAKAAGVPVDWSPDKAQSQMEQAITALGAEAAAELAYALLRGESPPEDMVTGTIDNGFKDVDAVLLTPIALTADNGADTILADGFWTVEQICADDYAAVCEAAGIE